MGLKPVFATELVLGKSRLDSEALSPKAKVLHK